MRLGGSPLLSNGSWENESFNISKLFTSEPDLATKLFLGHHLARCDDPRNISREILCFKGDTEFIKSDKLENDFTYILRFMHIDSNLVEKGVKSLIDFMQKQETVRNETKAVSLVMTIEELKYKFAMIPINWLELINSQMLRDSQVTEKEEIFVENPETMENLATLLMHEDRR